MPVAELFCMEENSTCGKGLAANSLLPAKMAALIAGLGSVLKAHRAALDLADQRSRQEDTAYAELADAYRDIADSLHIAAQRMAAYRDLPMGRHDSNALTEPEAVQAFARFVDHEKELLDLLGARLPDDEAMLARMSVNAK
jgi:hypothetical protein